MKKQYIKPSLASTIMPATTICDGSVGLYRDTVNEVDTKTKLKDKGFEDDDINEVGIGLQW